MPKRYFTTNKKGEEVEVEPALAKQLVQMGKKKPEDFTIEDLPYSQPEKQAKAQQLRQQAETMRQNRPQRIKEAQQEVINQMPPMKQWTMGIGKNLASTPGIKQITEMVSGQKLDPETFQTYEQATEASPAARVGEFTSDVALVANPAMWAGKYGQLKNLPKYAQGMLSGLMGGVTSAGIHQGQNLMEGKEISPMEAGVETAISTVLPGMGSLMKSGGGRIIQTATKLGRKIKGQKTMNPRQIEEYFKNYASWRGALGSEAKLGNMEDIIGSQFDNVMKKLAKGKSVNVVDIIKNARTRANRMGDLGKIDKQKVNKAIDEFGEMLGSLANKEGKVPFKVAQNFKKAELDEAALWDKPTPLGNLDPTLRPQAQAARLTRGKMVGEMTSEVPELIEANKAYKTMADIRPFVEAAAERTRANRGLSMQDLITLGIGGAGAGGAFATDNEKYLALSILPFLLSRGQKSPAVAKALWEMGQGMSQPGQLGNLGMQSIRSAVGGQ